MSINEERRQMEAEAREDEEADRGYGFGGRSIWKDEDKEPEEGEEEE